ncbi:MAG: hypothetical protein Q4A62_06565 [Eikenella sp.]|nr:hypothetical protein [Eikenella sp.]
MPSSGYLKGFQVAAAWRMQTSESRPESMKNRKNHARNLGYVGLAFMAVALLLTSWNEGVLFHIKRLLLVSGFVLLVASSIFTLLGKRAEFIHSISSIFSDARLVRLLIFQIIGGLLACVMLDGSYFVLFFVGACGGSLVWWLLAKK